MEPLTAERAQEIATPIAADAHCRYWNVDKAASNAAYRRMRKFNLDQSVKEIATALIDQRIETLEACAREHCQGCRKGIRFMNGAHIDWVGDGIFTCEAEYEQRELARLRTERQKLTAPNPSTMTG